jgi:hypothetical protein
MLYPAKIISHLGVQSSWLFTLLSLIACLRSLTSLSEKEKPSKRFSNVHPLIESMFFLKLLLSRILLISSLLKDDLLAMLKF